MDDDNKSHGGSLSDMNTELWERTQQSFSNHIGNPVRNAYGALTNADWSEVASSVADNLASQGRDYVNKSLDTIANNVDSAIQTGVNNITNMASSYVDNAVGKVYDKINNKFNSVFGKIEAKLRRGKFGKIDSWFGNPVLNSYKSIFGGLPGRLGSALKGSFRNNPWINFYIDGNNYVNNPGLPGGTGSNPLITGGNNRYKNGSINGPSASGNNRYKNGASTGSKPHGSNTYKTIPPSKGPSFYGPGDLTLFSTAAFHKTAEHIKNTYGFTGNINAGMGLERNFINRFGVTLIDNNLAHTRTHIFIGKPTCHILESDSGLVPEDLGKKDADLAMFINQDRELYNQLNARIQGATPFMTALQNRVVGISFQDASLSKSESAANIRGIRNEYPISYAESLVNVPLTLTFSMDRNAEVFKLINVWVTYMEKVKEGTLAQEYEDTIYNRMSYTCPIWIFVTEENNHDIIFWAKLVGNYPTSIPFSVFSNQGIINREVREISVQFSSAMFKPFDAYALMEFNNFQKVKDKKFWLDYVPITERNLSYYWVTGATVTLNDDTGKFRLNYYTSTGVAAGVDNAGYTTKSRGGFFGNLLGGIKNSVGGFVGDTVTNSRSYIEAGASKGQKMIASAWNRWKS